MLAGLLCDAAGISPYGSCREVHGISVMADVPLRRHAFFALDGDGVPDVQTSGIYFTGRRTDALLVARCRFMKTIAT